MPETARLIVACPETCSDLFWASCFSAPDPVIFLEVRGKRILILSDLELGRGRREANVDQVLSSSLYVERLRKKGEGSPSEMDVLSEILRERKIRTLEIPSYFPYGIATALKKRGFRLATLPHPFFPEREIKTEDEKKKIVQSIRVTEDAIRLAIKTIKGSKIRSGRLIFRGKVLTSDRLRRMMEISMMENGCLGQKTIVACGRQAADPHCIGDGPLYADQPIVLDVFPKSIATGYYGDVTRTVVKGHASGPLREMYEAVRAAQEKGFSLIRHGARAERVHQAVSRAMEARGFKTYCDNGHPEGFIHTTGHGLGLDIHEMPRIGPRPAILKKGQVVTVEPGLYYKKLGGVRIEDDVYVTRRGCEILSRLPRHLQVL